MSIFTCTYFFLEKKKEEEKYSDTEAVVYLKSLSAVAQLGPL